MKEEIPITNVCARKKTHLVFVTHERFDTLNQPISRCKIQPLLLCIVFIAELLALKHLALKKEIQRITDRWQVKKGVGWVIRLFDDRWLQRRLVRWPFSLLNAYKSQLRFLFGLHRNPWESPLTLRDHRSTRTLRDQI